MLRSTLAGASLIAICMGAVQAQEPPNLAGLASLPKFERRGIEKLAQLSAQEHSTIVFTIADETIGFVKDGAVGRIGRDWIHQCNEWTHPALSRGGRLVAYVSDGEAEGKPLHNCRIAIYNLATGAERTLLQLSDDPGEISWSWDDTRIVYFDRQSGLSEVSVASSVTQERPGRRSGSFWVWYPMQWLHNNRDLVVERSESIPVGAPGSYREQSRLLLEGSGGERSIGLGGGPSVSPVSDRIAYVAAGGIETINPDGTGKVRVFSSRAHLTGPIVWSPDGGRLFCGAIESEDRSDPLFLVDLKTGKGQKFLAHTSIRIRGWSDRKQ